MKSTLLAGALCLALLPPVYLGAVTPAHAQSGPACEYTVDEVLPILTEPFIVIDEPDAVKALVEMLAAAGEFDIADAGGVTRVLLAKLTGPDGVQSGYYGLEVSGCLLGPVMLPAGMDVPVVQRLSGKFSFGTFA